jgi:tetratricopeptide (TPR) repeat protein
LRPGGLLSQFVPLWSLRTNELRTVIRTFLAVFPESYLWYNSHELLLVGVNDARWRLSLDRMTALLADAKVGEDLEYSHWGGAQYQLNSPPALLGCLLAGPRELNQLAGDALVYRDTRPWLEYTTATTPPWTVIAEHARILGQHLVSPASALADDAPETIDEVAVRRFQQLNLRDLEAHVLVKQAQAKLAAEGLPAALESFARALERLPERVNTWVVQGLACQLSGDAARAKESYQRALQLDASRGDVHNNLAQLILADGHLDDAIEHARAALRLDPQNVLALCTYGIALQAAGQRNEAIQQFRKAVELHGTSSQAHYLLAAALRESGQLAESLLHLEQATAWDPTNLDALLARCETEFDLGLNERAAATFRSAADADPQTVAAHNRLGVLAMRLGNRDAAQRWFRAALGIDPRNPDAHYGLGNTFAAKADFRQAIVHFDAAAEFDPNNPVYRQYLAIALIRLGETDRAIQQFEEALRLDPFNPELARQLAEARRQRVKEPALTAP